LPLTTLKPRLTALTPRLGYTPGDEKARNHYRDSTQFWRPWYKTSRWQRLRWSVLVRDLFTCQACKRIVASKGEAIADHVRPHRGNEERFWDMANLQCLCKACHDSIKQAEDRGGRVKPSTGHRP
jgi:5-methylcytosine-specific restriction endonuclease McrA